MINLLSDEYKKEIRAAKVNTILLRYILILIGAVIILGGVSGGTFIVIYNVHQTSLERVAESQSKESGYSQIRTDADAFRSNLQTAKTILDKEINYSKLIYKIADAVPSNVVLDNLKLGPETLGATTTLNASAKTNNDAIRLKEAFTKKTNLFKDVKLQSITSGDASASTSDYPVKVTLSLTILKEASK